MMKKYSKEVSYDTAFEQKLATVASLGYDVINADSHFDSYGREV